MCILIHICIPAIQNPRVFAKLQSFLYRKRSIGRKNFTALFFSELSEKTRKKFFRGQKVKIKLVVKKNLFKQIRSKIYFGTLRLCFKGTFSNNFIQKLFCWKIFRTNPPSLTRLHFTGFPKVVRFSIKNWDIKKFFFKFFVDKILSCNFYLENFSLSSFKKKLWLQNWKKSGNDRCKQVNWTTCEDKNIFVV